MLEKLPGMSKIPDAVKNPVNDREIARTIAIINSMTPQEREFPAVIKASRRKRIAAGSGTRIQDVNKLLKQFAQMQRMMKKMKGKGMMNMLRGVKGGGGFPPGGMPPGGFPPGGGFPL
jgi:signal recognition particle subunit SRP54